MGQQILAIDQGTTGTTVLVIDSDLSVRARVSREFRQIYPRPGWVEHDAEEIWQSVQQTVAAALAEFLSRGGAAGDIAAVGITNQRETAVVWDRGSGRPVHHAIVWQDRRTAPRMSELRAAGCEPLVRSRTGLVLDPYFAGSKFAWILDHVEGGRRLAAEGRLAWGTVDSWLLWKLTGGAVHKTDVSNASRTMLMDLRSQQWDDQLLEMLDVPRGGLPRICSNAELLGELRGLPPLLDGTPVAGMAGDQQAALFGQTCFSPGEAKCTYGTGAFLLMNTGAEPVPSEAGLLTTAAWKLRGQMSYALEGSTFVAGAAVQWLRDALGVIETSADVESLAASVEDSGGLVFVPALTGLGAPHWNPEARGVIYGITRGTTKGHLARAALEGIALQNVDILRAMEQDCGSRLKTLRVDGGAAANDLLMQLQSDLLDCPIERPQMLETTALGSALMAGLGVGLFDDLQAIRRRWQAGRAFQPTMDRSRRQQLLELWAEGLRRV